MRIASGLKLTVWLVEVLASSSASDRELRQGHLPEMEYHGSLWIRTVCLHLCGAGRYWRSQELQVRSFPSRTCLVPFHAVGRLVLQSRNLRLIRTYLVKSPIQILPQKFGNNRFLQRGQNPSLNTLHENICNRKIGGGLRFRCFYRSAVTTDFLPIDNWREAEIVNFSNIVTFWCSWLPISWSEVYLDCEGISTQGVPTFC